MLSLTICLEPLYSLLRRNCTLGIARGMVCTAAFVLMLVITFPGFSPNMVEEASSFFYSLEKFLLQYTPRKWIQLWKLRPRVLREITVVR